MCPFQTPARPSHLPPSSKNLKNSRRLRKRKKIKLKEEQEELRMQQNNSRSQRRRRKRSSKREEKLQEARNSRRELISSRKLEISSRRERRPRVLLPRKELPATFMTSQKSILGSERLFGSRRTLIARNSTTKR